MHYVPNALTITRILLTPLFLVLLLSETFQGQLWAFIVFVVAAVSDWLDGKIARTFNWRSRLGQFLDPFADKVLVLSTFGALAFLLPNAITWWAVGLIALRDLVVTGLRTWREASGKPLATLPLARAKTAAQLTFLIPVLGLLAAAKLPGGVGRFAGGVLSGPAVFLGLLVVVGLTLYTGILYLVRQQRSSLAGS